MTLLLLGMTSLAVAACADAGTDVATSAPTPAAAAAQTTTPPEAPSAEPSTPAPEPTETPTAAPADDKKSPEPNLVVSPDSVVPDVVVVDVRSGEEVNVSSLVPSPTPVLLWAWAPHCPACRAEAPAAEAFAAAHVDEVTMVGLGTQDDFDYARGFLRDTGVKTPQMLWDPSFESWAQLGITAQPTWILVDGSGELLGGWVGAIPEKEVLDAVRAV